MKAFVKMAAAIYVLSALAMAAGVLWAFRFIRETDDAEGDDDWEYDNEWARLVHAAPANPAPTLPPRQPETSQPMGRVFDMRGTEYKFNQSTNTFQPVNNEGATS